jgi:DNA helicase-2/ATP-dependent DNA helicase PcrA
MENTQAFKEFFTQQLNSAQQEAVTPKKGALLVVAGAGSGKTRVITARIAHLILNEKVESSAIIALTFTNKAANEMKERIARFLGTTNTLPFIGTFHSYCLRLLKTNGEYLDQPFLSILDEDDQAKLLTGIIQRSGLTKRITAKQLSYQISQIKNQMQDPLTFSGGMDPKLLSELYNAYEKEKRMSRSLDFDDLLIEGLNLFKKHPAFKAQFQRTVRHILVDEYQDTNVIQHEFLKNMAQTTPRTTSIDSVCVVGDEDQSIYSWRGATVANVMNFKNDFPETQIIKIEQNYRSVQPILEVANHVIRNNKQRNPKNLWSDRPAKDRVRIITCMSNYQEGDTIAQLVTVASREKSRKATTLHQGSVGQVAVLYRAHFQSRTIEEALVKYSIPYKIIGGTQFYDRKEIKDLLAYLRLIINPFDRAAFFRVINCPTRGLGEKFEELFYERWNADPFSSYDAIIRTLIEEKVITGTKKGSLEQFAQTFKNLTHETRPLKALEYIIAHVAYITYLKTAYDTEEAQTRIDNVKELLRALAHFESNGITSIRTLLDEIALMQEHMQKDDVQDPVLLMTLHAAKGLEFDMVILCGLEEGLFPSSRSLMTDDGLEEERRLFYVGITRAKERLLITHARHRYAYGSMNDQIPSRFIQEIPKKLAPEFDGASWNITQAKAFFADWFNTKVPTTVLTFGASQPARETSRATAKSPSTRSASLRTNGSPTTKKTAVKTVTQKVKEAVAQRYAASKKAAPETVKPIIIHAAHGWRTNQPVSHKSFGIGVIKNIESRSDDQVFLTVQFKSGTKRIEQKFLAKV